MKTRVNLCMGLFAVAIAAAGCGPNITAVPPGPATGPTTLSPLLLPRLDGVWGGNMTLTLVEGGTGPARDAGYQVCGGAAFLDAIGETNFNSLSIKQDGTALEAQLASAGTGLACSYTGQVGSNGTVALVSESCSTGLTLRCANGTVVTLSFVSSTITATTDAPVRVTSIDNGRVAFTYNLDGQGLVAHHSFASLTKR